jgi:hypothetical protein
VYEISPRNALKNTQKGANLLFTRGPDTHPNSKGKRLLSIYEENDQLLIALESEPLRAANLS